jgi:hypothetical protein
MGKTEKKLNAKLYKLYLKKLVTVASPTKGFLEEVIGL